MKEFLSGVRVIDLSRILAGPYATMILADLGADVVKVERPGGGDDTRHWGPPFVDDTASYYLSVNRNKRSLTLDLKHPDGREIVWRLLAGADVVVSNFRAGVMERLGLDYETVRRRMPGLVYATISGYGPDPERARRAAFDLVIQAETGLMELTGEPDGAAVRSGISIADEVAGLYLVQGILAALLRRQRGGVGGRVEVPLNDALLAAFTYQAQQVLSTGEAPARMGAEHPSLAPYRSYPVADGALVVGVANEGQWTRLCEALEAPELAADARFATNSDRVRNRSALDEMLTARLQAETTAVWSQRLAAAGVPCGRVRGIAEALQEEVARDSGVVVDAAGFVTVASPILFDGERADVRLRPPKLGEHNDQILAEIGCSAEEVTRLRARSVI